MRMALFAQRSSVCDSTMTTLRRSSPMDRKPFQYSLSGLFILTTACAVLMSIVKTFPNASAHLAGLGLMLAGPLLFFLGSLLVFHGEVFFRHSKRFARVYAPLIGLLCIIAGVILFLFLPSL